MAVHKQVFDNDDHNVNPKKRSRITIDVTPELRRKIRIAAAERDLSISEFLGRILEEELSDEINLRMRQGNPITQEAIDRLRQIREEIMQDRHGKPFEESSLEMLWRTREERTNELMGEE